MRPLRDPDDRATAGKVPVRPGGILPQPVPQPTHTLRQAAPAPTLAENGVALCHRAALLCQAGGEDAHRDPHPGHAPLRERLPVADGVDLDLGRDLDSAPAPRQLPASDLHVKSEEGLQPKTSSKKRMCGEKTIDKKN